MNPAEQQASIEVLVAHPHLGQLLLEVLPDLLMDNPGADRFDGKGAMLVSKLRSHQDVTPAHDPKFKSHVDRKDTLFFTLLDEIDSIPPSTRYDAPVGRTV